MQIKRWQNLMDKIALDKNVETFTRLEKAYAELHRHYHTGQHIAACLQLLDEYQHLAEFPQSVELAIWFHDAIYRILRSDNEKKSAEWARDFLQSNGFDSKQTTQIYNMILATGTHVSDSEDKDCCLLLDIDLSILGSPQEEFQQYELNIRQEYQLIPGPLYKRKRCQILKAFLENNCIFQHSAFQQRFEQQARNNLEQAIFNLKG